jgi:hypothetical protein
VHDESKRVSGSCHYVFKALYQHLPEVLRPLKTSISIGLSAENGTWDFPITKQEC